MKENPQSFAAIKNLIEQYYERGVEFLHEDTGISKKRAYHLFSSAMTLFQALDIGEKDELREVHDKLRRRMKGLGDIFVNPEETNPLGVRGGATIEQAVLFDMDLWTKSTARKWLKEHKKKFGKILEPETGNYLHAVQIPSTKLKKDITGYRIFQPRGFPEGVKMRLGIRKGAPRRNPIGDNPHYLVDVSSLPQRELSSLFGKLKDIVEEDEIFLTSNRNSLYVIANDDVRGILLSYLTVDKIIRRRASRKNPLRINPLTEDEASEYECGVNPGLLVVNPLTPNTAMLVNPIKSGSYLINDPKSVYGIYVANIYDSAGYVDDGVGATRKEAMKSARVKVAQLMS